MHPLSGADLATFLAVSRRAGAPTRWGTYLAAFASVLCRSPFSFAERVRLANRLPQLDEMAPPIFILGHWRSGTTHLYNILGKGPFGYVPPVATGLPWDLMGLGTWLKPMLDKALPEHRWIDNVAVTPDAPQEDEIALANMTAVSFYHGIYFPHRFGEFLGEGVFFDGLSEAQRAEWADRFTYLLRKLSLHQGGKRMVIKNPVYTARLGLLRELIPHARFIHLRRNPYDVFPSMRNFYRKLFPPLALQRFDHVDIDEIVLETYARMMTAYDRDAADAPPEQLLELTYEELDADPLATVARIYEHFGVPNDAADRPTYAAYLDTVKKYAKNRFELSEAEIEKVTARWGTWIRAWGYGRPERPASSPSSPG